MSRRRYRNDAMGTARRRFVGGARCSAMAVHRAIGRHAGTEREANRITERHAWAVVLFREIEQRHLLPTEKACDIYYLPTGK